MPTRREARTSVLAEGQNLGAGAIHSPRANKKRGSPGNLFPGAVSPADIAALMIALERG